MKLLENKTVFITGGLRGIGLGIAKAYALHGATKIAVCGRNISQAEQLKKQIPNLYVYQADVSNMIIMKETATKIITDLGKIDILINNAGITKDNLTLKMSEQEWNDVININLKGVFATTKALIPFMSKQGKGSIINISSIVGTDGNIGQANYAAAKGGIIAMSKGWAKEFTGKNGKRQIRVNCIAPGFITTDMTHQLPESLANQLKERIPLARFGEVEDIANAAVFLGSDMSTYITGQTIKVNGGLVI